MRDPSLLVTRPTASDPSLAPRGHELFYVLAPAPNLSRGVVDWSRIGDSYTEQLIDTVGARLIPGFRDGAEVLHVVNPQDWARQGMIAGTPFALAHTFAQTGPFRPANTLRGIDNAVLAGSSTVPGVGVPTAMISGRLAADRITGIVDASTADGRGESRSLMIRTELTAAGIDDPDLRGAYRRCRTLNAAHGRTFFLATRLLAPDQRPPIHALYGFARYADDILDDFDPALDTATRAARLQQLSDQFFSADEHPANPVLAAVRHTARRYDIGDELFDDFLNSMRMDLTITDYPDRAALNLYMKGSAEAIGLQVLPILGTIGPGRRGRAARGSAGQSIPADEFPAGHRRRPDCGNVCTCRPTNWPPTASIATLLMWCHHNRRTDRRVRNALAEQHEIARQVYRYAADGVADAGTAVTAMRSHRADAVLGNPGPHRRLRLCGVQPARDRGQRPTAARRRRRPVAFVAGPADAPGRIRRSQIRCGVMDHWQYLIVLGGLPGDHAAAGDLSPRRLPSSLAGRARCAARRGRFRALG